MIEFLDPLLILVSRVPCLVVHSLYGERALAEAFVTRLAPYALAGTPPSLGEGEVCTNNPLHRPDRFRADLAAPGGRPPEAGLAGSTRVCGG